MGGEKVLLLSAAAWGSMTAFTPILAHFCSQPILSMTLSRFLMGLLQGETVGFHKKRKKWNWDASETSSLPTRVQTMLVSFIMSCAALIAFLPCVLSCPEY